ncbi:hypothetical protein [Cognatilysobacter lacus]|uniref:Uncharacterized protein n=1 Tax=Cognatilysobacter lacus TaxID=1643323 RepID=A0A5D8Z4F5_9GAMM|nr:hypothetical protein [Lysobacter lacus]TZF89520.1 hypothetical protein FW784_08695 [Lysobacter lacus]
MTTWPGWTQDDTLVLPLDDSPPTAPLEIDGRVFAPKQELHVTVVAHALGRELRDVLGDRLEAGTRPAFEALDWSYRRTEQRRVIRRPGVGDDGKPGTLASVIELVEMPALGFYHRWLGELLGRQLTMPPAHITLYTHGKASGIGIPTERCLRAWSRREAALPG